MAVLGRRWGPDAAIAAGLVALTGLLYWSALDLGFFRLDDPAYVTQNPLLKEITLDTLRRACTEVYFTFYSPMHLLSYVPDRLVGGFDPWFFHLSNHLWAGAAAVMVHACGLVLLRDRALSALAAVLFVVHPAHVEAVAWISARKDLVSTTFALACIASYVRYRSGGARARTWYALSLVTCLLAIAGKQSVVVLPAVLAVLDWFWEKRRGWALAIDKIPHVAIIAFFVARSLGSQPDTGLDRSVHVMARSALEYGWLLTGFGEHALYRARAVASPSMGVNVLVLAVVVLIGASPLLMQRWLPGLVTALACWLLGSLTPALAINVHHPVDDRKLFFPTAALALLLVACARWAGSRWEGDGRAGRPLRVAAGVLVILSLCWTRATVGYLGEWDDPRSVFHASSQRAGSARNHQYLGSHHHDAARALKSLPGEEQRAELTALAATLWEDEARLEALRSEWAGGSLGPVSRELRADLLELAERSYATALETKTTLLMPAVHYRRGLILKERDDSAGARASFEAGLQEARQHDWSTRQIQMEVFCRSGLAVLDWGAGDHAKARQHYLAIQALQHRAGRTWIPDVDAHLKRLDRILGVTR